MTQYICQECSKSFDQKSHYDTHKKRKIPCTSPKKILGQYFTISEDLQQFVFDKVKHKGSLLLEPSFGAGHLLKKFLQYNSQYPVLCYELDEKITPVVSFSSQQTPVYGDFTKQRLTQKFKTIIGNPPYVKQSTGNLYLQFIEQCFQYLDEKGELIFIVPSDFLKLTSSSKLLETMTEQGSFTDFLFPQNEQLFEGASIDVVVFRYEKGLQTKKCTVNGEEKYCNVQNGIITFSTEEKQGTMLSELFDVYVGIVSGRDKIFKKPFGNIQVLNDKNKVETYIFTDKFPTPNEQINTHLSSHKTTLLGRKIKAFTEKNWFEWGAPRNRKVMENSKGKPCIYVKNMTRSKEVAFISTVQYFGGSLLCLIPKTNISLENTVKYLNTEEFQKNYMYSGRFKIGHKQLCSALIPT